MSRTYYWRLRLRALRRSFESWFYWEAGNWFRGFLAGALLASLIWALILLRVAS